MNRRDACIALAGSAGALATAGCVPGAHAAPETLLIGGAAAMLPLAKALARSFLRDRPGLSIVVEPGGSLPAYIAASRGATDLAAMTRVLSDSEDDAGAHHYLVARDDIGIIVNRTLGVDSVTRAQARALFTGEIANWRALGGPDRTVTVYAHRRGAAARRSAEQLILEGSDFGVDTRECAGDAALVAAVAADPGAIAYLDGRARAGASQVAVLSIDGVAATRATVLSGRYPFTHSFYLLLHGEPGGARSAFVRFARSPAGQAVVERLGLVSVC